MPVTLSRLNDKVVLDTEIQAMLNDLGGYINTSSVENDNVEPGQVEYRNIEETPRRVLGLNEDAATLAAIGGGWFLLSNITAALASSVSEVENEDGEANAVVQVEARLHLSDWETHAATAQFKLAYSTDNGGTWNGLNTTVRPVGIGSGYTHRYFDSPVNHYWGGAPGYVPGNQPYDGVLVLLGAFGGNQSLSDPRLITHYGILVDNASMGAGPDYTQFFLRTRDRA